MNFTEISNIYSFFNVYNYEEQTIATVFVAVFAVVLILRIFIFIGYQSQTVAVKIFGKSLSGKEDYKKIKHRFVRHLSANFIASGSCGTPDAYAASENTILKFRFLFWNYRSMSRLVSALENVFLVSGVVLAFIMESSVFFGILGVGAFAASKLLASFFDFDTALENLKANCVFYLQQELGKFFINDLSGIAASLKNELSNWGAMFDRVAKTVPDTERIASLGEAIETLKDISKSAKAQLDTVESSLALAEKSRAALEDSLLSHESMLAGINEQIGVTLGKIIEDSLQKSYADIGEEIRLLADRVALSNTALAEQFMNTKKPVYNNYHESGVENFENN
ncbi:MAG: hypothetical protein LBM16_01650 [Clostridiales bacterium]|jgi:hypothetical protein|nr:hypothetical protein [Clostridiales bacterium]